MDNLAYELNDLPGNLANHLMISVIPLVIGVAVSLPLAIFVTRRARYRYGVLTVVGVIQTIPSLALLALMVPILVALSVVTTKLFGFEISALGLPPTVVALTLYSMLPIVRNTVTGIDEVSGALTEAARGLGMTERQVLWKVELPLAAPVIIAGIRTATVWVVGIATLATPVGQRCLGNFIFRGLQTRNWTAVLVGCVAAAVLAILLDMLLGGIERSVKTRNRALGLSCGIALVGLLVGGMAAPTLAKRMSAGANNFDGPLVVRIGAKTFTEQYILADALAQLLDRAHVPSDKIESLGSTVVFDALASGDIDCYVDYSGTIWANHMKRAGTAPAATVLSEMTDWLATEHGVVCLGSLGFENAYGLAMLNAKAKQLNLSSIANLANHSRDMKIGGDYEFFGRPEWHAIRDTYHLAFSEKVSFDSTFMYEAVARGEVDVISAFTSDGRIAAFDLVVLDDPANVIPPYDAVLLLSANAVRRPEIVNALKPLIGTISVDTMRHANLMVDRDKDKKTVGEAAAWLLDQAGETARQESN